MGWCWWAAVLGCLGLGLGCVVLYFGWVCEFVVCGRLVVALVCCVFLLGCCSIRSDLRGGLRVFFRIFGCVGAFVVR